MIMSMCGDQFRVGVKMIPRSLHWFATARAYKILGLIRRTFHTNCIITKMKLYLSLVRSQLMYCSQLWRPSLIKDIHSLQRVQRRATKYILNNYSSDYKSRLMNLKLLLLMYIYEMNDISFLSNPISPLFTFQHPWSCYLFSLLN